MSIAKLSIDLEARLADLQAGLDKAGLLAERSAERIKSTFDGIGAVTKAMAGTLGVAFSVAGITAFVRATVDGLDRLNDLKDATGASIENLSALEDIALRTGTSMDTASDAVLKLNKALLAASDPKSDAAAAIKAIGLSLDDLKRMDPVEALQAVGTALAGFRDDANKGRIGLVLLNKSWGEVAPLLKDLAEAGKLNATVTAQQTAEAEKLNKQIFALQKNFLDLARTVAGPAIEALNRFFAEMAASKQAYGSGSGAFWDNFFDITRGGTVNQQLTDTVSKIAALNKVIQGNRDAGRPTIMNAGLVQEVALLEKREKFLRLMQKYDAGGAGAGRGFVNPGDTELPSLPDVAAVEQAAKRNRDAQKAAERAAEERIKLAEFAAKQIVEIEDQAARDTAEAWGFWEKSKLAESEQRQQRLNALLDATPTAKLGEDREAMLLLADAFERGTISAEQFAEAATTRLGNVAPELKAQIDEMQIFADQAARNIQDALGNTLEATLSGNFDNIGQMWKSLLIRMASEAAAAKIGKELLGDFGSTGKLGGSIGDLFQWLTLLASEHGNAFDGGRVQAFASGGILGPAGGLLTRPTVFPMANGGIGIGGEAGTEAVMPLARTRGGKLGVRAEGGGRAMVVQPTINVHIDSRTDAAVVGQLVAQGVQEGQRQMLEYLRAGGVLQ